MRGCTTSRDGDGGKAGAFVLRPPLAAIDADPEAEFGAEEEQIRVARVFLDDVGVAADAAA